jgi:hypothetical protein
MWLAKAWDYAIISSSKRRQLAFDEGERIGRTTIMLIGKRIRFDEAIV